MITSRRCARLIPIVNFAVIYFYHSANIPLFALSAYAKNDRADLSQKDRNDFRQLTKLLAETCGRTKK